jgi:hypothetical protein
LPKITENLSKNSFRNSRTIHTNKFRNITGPLKSKNLKNYEINKENSNDSQLKHRKIIIKIEWPSFDSEMDQLIRYGKTLINLVSDSINVKDQMNLCMKENDSLFNISNSFSQKSTSKLNFM